MNNIIKFTAEDLQKMAVTVAEKCEEIQEIDLDVILTKDNDPEFFYEHLDLCIIDAVFSIGINYESVKKTVNRYKNYIGDKYPEYKTHRTISDSIAIFTNYENNNIEKFAENILSLHRTSTRNGILKVEAVLEIMKILKNNCIEDISQFRTINKEVHDTILAIKGQSSGIMLKYLYMLTGDENSCKPDRMLHRFVENILNVSLSNDELRFIVTESCTLLKEKHPNLTVRALDNQIWRYQKSTK